MAVPFPQEGNAKNARGLFLDDGVAGQIVFDDYFAVSPPISNADLTGSITLSFAASGTLDGASGDAALTGSTSLSFITSGALAGNVQITGATSLTFTTGGILNGAALLGGSSLPTFALSGMLTTQALLIGSTSLTFTGGGTLDGDGDISTITNRGDDVRRSKRPVIQYRPKAEKALEQVLELVEDIEPQNRTSVKRAAVKQAREAFRAINLPVSYEPATKAISEALARVSRAAGEYQAFQEAAMLAAMEIEQLIAEMDRKRHKRRKEEEMVISWLLS